MNAVAERKTTFGFTSFVWHEVGNKLWLFEPVEQKIEALFDVAHYSPENRVQEIIFAFEINPAPVDRIFNHKNSFGWRSGDICLYGKIPYELFMALNDAECLQIMCETYLEAILTIPTLRGMKKIPFDAQKLHDDLQKMFVENGFMRLDWVGKIPQSKTSNDLLLAKIKRIPTEKQKKLLLTLCQRQGLFYANFCQKIGQSADPFWAILERLGKEAYSEKITEEIKSIAPDMDDFAENLAATKALDACAILNQTFLFFADPKPEIWETIIELYLNVPEMIAQETQNEAFFKQEKDILEKWIETEPTLITPEISQKLLPSILKKDTAKMHEILCKELGIFDAEKEVKTISLL